MVIRFIVDTHLPPLLREKLTELGFDAIHTCDCPRKEFSDDSEIRNIAIEQNRIIVTKDADFHDYYIIKGAPPKILMLKIGNCSNKELLEIISKHLPQIISYLGEQGEDFIMVWKDFIAVI